MEKRIKIRKVDDSELWDDFVEQSPHGTMFSSTGWITAGAKAMGGVPVFIGVWDGDRLIAGVSFVEVVKGPFRKAVTPVLTPYGGLLYSIEEGKSPQDTSSLQLLCAETVIGYLTRKYHHVSLAHSCSFSDVRPYLWKGWTALVRYTYIIDVSDMDSLWDRFRKGTKSKIRQAEKTVTPGGSVDAFQLGLFYEKVFRERNQLPPVPHDRVAAFAEQLIKAGMLDVTTVHDQGGSVAGLQVAVADKNTAYTWMYGTLPGKNQSGADSLLIWKAANRYHDTHKNLDLVGANIPSVAFFKKGFGGVLTPYYVTRFYSSFAVRVAFWAFAAIRKLTGR